MAPYASVAELRAQIDKQVNDVGKPGGDTNLLLLLTAATRAINGVCNQPDGFLAASSATARTYPGSGKGYQLIDNCVEITSVSVKVSPTDSTYSAWLAADWIAFRGDPSAPEFNSLSWAEPRPFNGIMVGPSGSHAVFTSGSYSVRPGFPIHEDDRARAMAAVPTVSVTAKWGFAVAVPETVKEACLIQAARWVKRGEGGWADALANADMGTLHFTKSLDPDIVLLLKLGRLIRPSVGRR